MNPVATSDAAFRGGACPTPEYTIAYTGNYTTSADANPFEEREELIVGPEPARRCGWSSDASERLLLHPHVGVDVDLGGLDGLVPEP